MANELTKTGPRPIATPEGARALHRLASSVAWGESDGAEARRWLAAPLVALLPAARMQAAALLAPAAGDDFARQLSPTLALVAPAGMSEDDQVAWLATAGKTLSGMPADLLARGCEAARRKADHPSRIVAAIFAEVGQSWDRRKAELGNVERLMGVASGDKQAARPWEHSDDFDPADRCTPEQATAIRQAVGLDLEKTATPVPTGPRRNPTTAELVEIASAIGVAPGAALPPGVRDRRLERDGDLRAAGSGARGHDDGWGTVMNEKSSHDPLRERQRVEHLVLGRDRPVVVSTAKRQGKRRTTKSPVLLSPGIEEAVQLRERWSHKQGTPETLDAVSRTHQGALAQLHANGTIDNEQLEWAAQIANVARSIEADVAVAVASLEARVDQSRSSAHLAGESVYRVRMHAAYTDWRIRLPMPKRLVLDMLTGDAIGYTVAGRRYGVGKREALRQLMAAINRWPDCVARAYRRIDQDDVVKMEHALR